MSNTRRQTLVAVLRGTNGYSLSELNAMYAVPGVQDFLVEAESRGISHKALADALVAFKKNGGSGLQTSLGVIRKGWNTPAVAPATVAQDKCAAAAAVLQQAVNILKG